MFTLRETYVRLEKAVPILLFGSRAASFFDNFSFN